MDTHLNERQRRFADGILQGLSQREAYKRAGYTGTGNRADSYASQLLNNSKVREYLAERREELAEVALVEAEEVVRELTWHAFFDFGGLVNLTCPEDLLSLPAHRRRLVKGWRWDRWGHFIPRLVDRQRALIELSRVLGLFRGGYTNARQQKADLMNDLFWRWVTSQHLHTGKPVPELATYGKAHPEEVQAWGREVGFLPSGDEVA